MLRTSAIAMILTTGVSAGSVAIAAPAASAYRPVAALIKTFISPDGAIGWPQLDGYHGVKWVTKGPIMLDKTLDTGDSYARPGVFSSGGQTFDLGATGSLAGVGSIFFSATSPAAPVATVVAGLRQTGIELTAARCPRNPARVDRYRGWYRLMVGKISAYLYIGRLTSGRQGYTLYLSYLPPMTQEQVANFVDCPGGHAATQAAGEPATGQAGVIAVVEALLRPTGTPAWLPWRTPLPAVTWNKLGPQKIPRGQWSAGGPDVNPEQLNGDFTTPTTHMTVDATGNAKGANRFYLEGGENLPSEAIFNGLRRDGYTITSVTCGKPYIKMSENWFRIARRGKQPAILYRSMSVSTGRPTQAYAIRLDNVPPPLQPGQSHANGGACRELE